MFARIVMTIAALLAAAGVGLGAYQAHGLEGWLTRQDLAAEQVARRLQNAEIAVRYLLVHAVGLLAIGAILAQRPSRLVQAGAGAMLLGMLLFCGGLLLIVLTGQAGHWSVVPAGGLTLIVAWILTAAGCY